MFLKGHQIILSLGFYTKTIRTYVKISKYIIRSYFYRGELLFFSPSEHPHFKYIRLLEVNKYN